MTQPCKHGEEVPHVYLECLDYPGYEVYLCQCGALINIRDRRNFSGETWHMMDAKDIAEMIEVIKQT